MAITQVVESLLIAARGGDTQAIKIVLDRTFGRQTDIALAADPFIKIGPHHDERAKGFFDFAEKVADGRPMSIFRDRYGR